MNDIGKYMGIYFYVIGLMHIISIFIIQKTTGNIYLDLQFIGCLLAGYYLMKHHDKTRKIIIIICGIIMLMQGAILLYATFIGFSDSGSWQIMGFPIQGDNAQKYLGFSALLAGIVYAIPFFVLRSEKAKKEFSKN